MKALGPLALSWFNCKRKQAMKALIPLAMNWIEYEQQQSMKALGPLARSVRHILAPLG